MPTKIIAGRSNTENGEINQQDLKRIIQDFENFADIKSTISREFLKVNTVSIPFHILNRLLEKVTPAQRDATTIDIKFGITLPEQKQCDGDKLDVSDHLTVVVMINRGGSELQDQVDDFIITPGFKESSDGGLVDRACCPVITPRRP